MAALCRGCGCRLTAALEPDEVVLGRRQLQGIESAAPRQPLVRQCQRVAGWDFGFETRSTKMEALAELPTISPTVTRPAWKALEAHYKKVRKLHLRKLFA